MNYWSTTRYPLVSTVNSALGTAILRSVRVVSGGSASGVGTKKMTLGSGQEWVVIFARALSTERGLQIRFR